MTKQVTVRLADDVVRQIDRRAAETGQNRTRVIELALRREIRRLEGLRDAAIYAADGESDLDGMTSTSQAGRAWSDLE